MPFLKLVQNIHMSLSVLNNWVYSGYDTLQCTGVNLVYTMYLIFIEYVCFLVVVFNVFLLTHMHIIYFLDLVDTKLLCT